MHNGRYLPDFFLQDCFQFQYKLGPVPNPHLHRLPPIVNHHPIKLKVNIKQIIICHSVLQCLLLPRMNSKAVSQLSRRGNGCIVKGDMTLQRTYSHDPLFDQHWHSLLLHQSINVSI